MSIEESVAIAWATGVAIFVALLIYCFFRPPARVREPLETLRRSPILAAFFLVLICLSWPLSIPILWFWPTRDGHDDDDIAHDH